MRIRRMRKKDINWFLHESKMKNQPKKRSFIYIIFPHNSWEKFRNIALTRLHSKIRLKRTFSKKILNPSRLSNLRKNKHHIKPSIISNWKVGYDDSKKDLRELFFSIVKNILYILLIFY